MGNKDRERRQNNQCNVDPKMSVGSNKRWIKLGISTLRNLLVDPTQERQRIVIWNGLGIVLRRSNGENSPSRNNLNVARQGLEAGSPERLER